MAQGGDNCGGATVLAINATCTTSAITNNENGRPEVGSPNPGCGSGTNPGSDVWYRITGTGGNVDITFANSNRDASLAIWSDCPATTLVTCLAITAGNTGSIIIPTVAATTYYIQIKRRSGGDNANMAGDICATNVSSAAPPNDNPCSATALPVNASCVTTTTTNLNATSSPGVPPPGCASYSGGDVWYSFVVPASGSVNIESFANSLSDGGMALYTGACGALTLLSCDDDSGSGLMPSLAASGLVPGATVFIRFWEFGNNANGTFRLCVSAGTPPTGNQNCSTATQICNDAAFGGNSDGFANQELNAANQGCLSTEHQASWFYFSPVTTGTFSMAIRPSAGVDYDFAIWGPYNSLTCPVNTAPIRCSFASDFSTSFESIQPSPGDVATGLSATGNGNGNPVGAEDGTGTDILDGWVSPITVAAGDLNKIYVLLIDNFTADATAFNIDLTFGAGLTCNCTPLAVDYHEINGQNVDNRFNKIFWSTASEENNDYFILERSNDGNTWESIATINGNGSTTMKQNYVFDDFEYIKDQINYYQLKQYDFDGNYKPSKIIMVNNETSYLIKTINLLGQNVDETYKGIVFEIYSNGKSVKTYRK